MNLLRRVMALVVAMLAGLIMLAPPAGAHSVSGAGASNFLTTLTALDPQVPGLELRVIEAGSRLKLVNHTGQDIVVLGYTGEPYLRVGPAGIFTNRHSSATYLNATRQGTSAFPPGVDQNAPPLWDKVASGQVARWHDHRTHWMGGQLPPLVRQHPDRRQLVGTPWSVDLMQGNRKITATGTLEWIPKPNSVPWTGLAIVLAAGAAWIASRTRAFRLPALLLGVLVAIDVVHAAGLAAIMAGPLGTRLGRAAAASLVSIVAWALAIVAIALLLRARPQGRSIGLFAALMLLVSGGLLDRSFLSHATLPFGFAAWIGRGVVAATLGLGVGLAVGWLVVLFAPVFRAPRPAPVASTPADVPSAPTAP